jgi:hypothetical protein
VAELGQVARLFRVEPQLGDEIVVGAALDEQRRQVIDVGAGIPGFRKGRVDAAQPVGELAAPGALSSPPGHHVQILFARRQPAGV